MSGEVYDFEKLVRIPSSTAKIAAQNVDSLARVSRRRALMLIGLCSGHVNLLSPLLVRKEEFIPVKPFELLVETIHSARGRRARSAKPSVRAH